LEAKESDFIQLKAANTIIDIELGRMKGEMTGLNVVKSLLKEKEDEIKKLNTELHEAKKGSPINPHKHCELLEL
jgi:hypothetical protein